MTALLERIAAAVENQQPAVIPDLTDMLREATVKAASVKEVATTCRVCGAAIEQPKRGRKREFCSDTCRYAFHDAQKIAERRKNNASTK